MFSSYSIKKGIRKIVAQGVERFIIYPFGDNGLLTKTVLQEYFGLQPLLVVDNEYAKYNQNIISIKQLKEKYEHSMYIILTIENNKTNMDMQNELLEFTDLNHIINLKAEEQNACVEKQRTLMENMINRFGDCEEEIRKLLYTDYENVNVIRIYSPSELKDIDRLCFSFVKKQLEREAININSITDVENSILFFAPLFESFWTNILPLFRKYIEKGHKCVVMFSSMEHFWWTGENLNRILNVMDEIKEENGQCVLYDDCYELETKFKICFFCSEYSVFASPGFLRSFADKLVSVQTTGIYKHIYKSQTSIDLLYDEFAEVDYYVGSDYICEWINSNNETFKDKMLHVGYPKMDTLYNNLNRHTTLPSEWVDKIGDRKVILLTIENPELYIDIFSRFPHLCFIWRPDPEFMGTKSCCEKMNELKRKVPCLIIDEERTYVNAFNASTAMIGMAIFCVPVNYIFANKPLLLLDGELNMYHKVMAMEYQNEAWYKACYIADEEKKIEDFIRMIDEGKDYLAWEQKPYRDIMNRNFDGNVCERVYQTFESKR